MLFLQIFFHLFSDLGNRNLSCNGLQSGSGYHSLCCFLRKAAAHQIKQRLFIQFSDRSSVVSFHILLRTEDQRNRLIHHVVAEKQNVLLLISHGTSTTFHEINAAPEKFESIAV